MASAQHAHGRVSNSLAQYGAADIPLTIQHSHKSQAKAINRRISALEKELRAVDPNAARFRANPNAGGCCGRAGPAPATCDSSPVSNAGGGLVGEDLAQGAADGGAAPFLRLTEALADANQEAYPLDFIMKMLHVLWPNAERAFARKIQYDIVPMLAKDLPPAMQDIEVSRIYLGKSRPKMGPLRLVPPNYRNTWIPQNKGGSPRRRTAPTPAKDRQGSVVEYWLLGRIELLLHELLGMQHDDFEQ
eukprot:g13905.t1